MNERDKQPQALELADALDLCWRHVCGDEKEGWVANELRRLHEVNQVLLEALVDAERFIPVMDRKKARAAIAKATGESK